MDIQNKKMNKEAILVAFLLFALAGSYFFWWLTTNLVLNIATKLFICFIFYKYKKQRTHTDRMAVTLYCVALSLMVLLSIMHGNTTFFGAIDRLLNFAMIPILLVGTEFSEQVYRHFFKIYAVVVGLSLIAFVFYMLGMLPAIGELTSGQERSYTVYPFLVRENTISLSVFSRFCSVFDEPGVVGTFSAILLCINRFNLKDWKNIIVLLAGIISMSMFFYALVAIYAFLFLIITKRNYILALVVCMAMGAFYYVTKDDPYISEVMWARFEWDEDKGGFIGDDRMVGDADYYFENKIQGTPAYWWGTDNIKEFWEYSEGSSSYKVVVASNGMVFLTLYILVFIVLAYGYKNNRSDLILFVLVLLLNSYQRPNIYYPIWIFLYMYYARLKLENIK